MTDKREATSAMETILSLSEQVIEIARANIAKARAAQDVMPQLVEPPERTEE